MSPRIALVLLLGAVSAAFLHREQQRGTFSRVDDGHLAWLKANRKEPTPRAAANVVFVRLDDIDKSESDRQFEAWPPSAGDWSAVLEELRNYSPASLAIHTMLGWGGEPDPQLTEACRKFPSLIAGVLGQQHAGTADSPDALPNCLTRWPAVAGLDAPEFSQVLYAKEMADLPSTALTNIDLSDDPAARPVIDAGVCRVPLLYRHAGGISPSFLLAAFMQSLGISPDKVQVRPGEAILLGDVRLPIDQRGVFTFHLHAANLQPVPSLNLDTFKLNKQQLDRFLPKNDPVRSLLPTLAESTLVIGQDDRASRRLALPDGRQISAADLTAQILTAMQTGKNVRPLEPTLQLVAVGGALLFGLWQTRFLRGGALKMGFIGVLLWVVATLTTFQTSAVWLPLTPALGVMLVSTLICLLFPPASVAVQKS